MSKINLKNIGAVAAEAAAQFEPAEPTPAQIAKDARERAEKAKLGQIAPPIHVFPKEIQEMVADGMRVYGAPLDFYLGGLLAAGSIAIGNRFVAAYRHDCVHPANLYIVLIGTSGMGKTPVLKAMLSEIFNIEAEMKGEEALMREKWKQRANELKIEKRENELPPMPNAADLILQDAMLPSIQMSLQRNQHGVLASFDEIRGWISNLQGRHQTGDETSFWLSTFDTSFTKVTRQSRDTVWLKSPFITVVGGIQPDVVKRIATGDHVDSGMFNRFTFCYPQSMEKPGDTENDTDPNLMAFFRKTIRKIYELPSHFVRPTAKNYDPEGLGDLETTGEDYNERIKIWLSDDARKTYAAWKEDNRQKRNNYAVDDERLASIYDKQETFVLRYALILEMYKLGVSLVNEEMAKQTDPWAGLLNLENVKQIKIGVESIRGGIELSAYSESTSRRVLERFESPVNALPANVRALYRALDVVFKTSTAKAAGKEMGLSERQVERMLEGSFGNVVKAEPTQGWYKKLYF